MCLTNVNYNTYKIQWQRDSIYGPPYVYVYKVLKATRKNLNSINNRYCWKQGVNHFLDNKKLNKKMILDLYVNSLRNPLKNGRIHYGLHVYLDADEALAEINRVSSLNVRVVRFKAYQKDFIAYGKNNRKTKGAVFTQLYLSRSEYKRALS